MPSLGADMKDGTLCEWKIKPGDRVHRGDIVAVVDTDKAAIDMEIWEDGIVEDILVDTGEKVPVGTVLAKISSEETKAPKEAPFQEKPRVKVTPLARKVASEIGVDPTTLLGSGPGGSITEKDVRSAKEKELKVKQEKKMEEKISPEKRIRHSIAEIMAHSKREIPHYYLLNTVDMGACLDFLEKENTQRSPQDRIIYAAALLKAVALAAKEFPEINGFWQNEEYNPSDHVHIGMGITLKKAGLISPAILDVDKKSLGEIMSNLRSLIERARHGGLRTLEMSSATITVTNLGELGVDQVFGVIYPPQVALVGFGKILKNRTIKCTLSADHRASDGYRGAQYLDTISKYLQHPEQL